MNALFLATQGEGKRVDGMPGVVIRGEFKSVLKVSGIDATDTMAAVHSIVRAKYQISSFRILIGNQEIPDDRTPVQNLVGKVREFTFDIKVD